MIGALETNTKAVSENGSASDFENGNTQLNERRIPTEIAASSLPAAYFL